MPTLCDPCLAANLGLTADPGGTATPVVCRGGSLVAIAGGTTAAGLCAAVPPDTSNGTCRVDPVVCRNGSLVTEHASWKYAGMARLDWTGQASVPLASAITDVSTFGAGVTRQSLITTNDSCSPMQTLLVATFVYQISLMASQTFSLAVKTSINGALYESDGIGVGYIGPGGYTGERRQFISAGPLIASGGSMQFDINAEFQVTNGPANAPFSGFIGYTSALRVFVGTT